MGGQIAAIIVEPVAGNMNCVPPVDGFLGALREVCTENDSVLLFDEVMTGFRVDLTGAQGLYRIEPDLTTFGKVIGGGMPVGAFGGRAEIMDHISPDGPVYQAGTLSGNPVAMAAGLATLKLISEPGFYEALGEKTEFLTAGIKSAADRHGVELCTQRVGAMFGLFFTAGEQVRSFSQVMACSVDRFGSFFHRMLDAGIYLAPSAFEAGFVSASARPGRPGSYHIRGRRRLRRYVDQGVRVLETPPKKSSHPLEPCTGAGETSPCALFSSRTLTL